MNLRHILLAAFIASSSAAYAETYDFGKLDKNSSPSEWGENLEKQHKDDWNVDSTPSSAMYQILSELANVKPDSGWYHGPCERAAINAAWDVWGNAQGTGITKAWGKTFKDIGKNVWDLAGGGVEEFIVDQVKSGVKGALTDKIKEFFKGKKVKSEVFTMSGTRGECKYVLYVVANIVNSTVDVVISGNCGCTGQRCYDSMQTAKVSAFALHLQGPISYKVADSKIEGVSLGALRKIYFKANCEACEEKKTVTPPVDEPKPEVKTCPPCQPKADELEEAYLEAERLQRQARELQNKIMDAEREGKDTKELDKALDATEKKQKKAEARVKELEAKKESCEKKKCGGVSYEEPAPTEEINGTPWQEEQQSEEISTTPGQPAEAAQEEDNGASSILGILSGVRIGVGTSHRRGHGHGDDGENKSHGMGGGVWCSRHQTMHPPGWRGD